MAELYPLLDLGGDSAVPRHRRYNQTTGLLRRSGVRWGHGYDPHQPLLRSFGIPGYRLQRFRGFEDPTSRVTQNHDARCSPTPGHLGPGPVAQPYPTVTGSYTLSPHLRVGLTRIRHEFDLL